MTKNLIKFSLFLITLSVALVFSQGAFAYQQPVVNAGPDLYLSFGQSATLQGSAYDTNGLSLTFNWSCTGGVISSTGTTQPTYTAPSQYGNGHQSYICTLTATNSYGYSASDSTSIYVNYNGGSNGALTVLTTGATDVSGYAANLNGYVQNPVLNQTYAWFQWGTGSNYGQETQHQLAGNNNMFTYRVSGLYPNTAYQFRLVAQTNNGNIVYGESKSFTTNNSGYPNGGSGGSGYNYNCGSGLTVTKKVINLTSGNLNWQSSVNARPNDLLAFSIILQAGSCNENNIYIRDSLPTGLMYAGNTAVNSSVSNVNPQSGVSVGTLLAGQKYILSYQARVSTGIQYGSAIASNNATVTSSESGTRTAGASVVISNSGSQGGGAVNPAGPTFIPTGLTNNFLGDSFLLPLLLIIFALWLHFSGILFSIASWFKTNQTK